jgi:hypothetical protein
MSATVWEDGDSAKAPSTCHRALVSPRLLTRRSPAQMRRPFSRNTSRMSDVSV